MLIVAYYAFMLYGLCLALVKKPIPRFWMGIFTFVSFKLLANYRKCTLSYVECKLRNVKKNDGYIHNVLEEIMLLRESSLHVMEICALWMIVTYSFIRDRV
jgi:hypothetical protein